MTLNFDKNKDGLIPAIIQDVSTKNVLMLGYMNREAYEQTRLTNKVTFFSRTKNRLWTKGEESGNFLEVKSVECDCDNDSLLIKVDPKGPTCHTGTDTCWGETNIQGYGFLTELENIIELRKNSAVESSYVASLFKKGINKIAQKVGEEAVEMVIEAKDSDDKLFLEESADLLFHYLILLRAKGIGINEVAGELSRRNAKKR